MPILSASLPLELEMMSGRVPFAVVAACAPFPPANPNALRALAAMLPASEVKKNFRRVNSLIALPPCMNAIANASQPT
jgi:hypothetical protein